MLPRARVLASLRADLAFLGIRQLNELALVDPLRLCCLHAHTYELLYHLACTLDISGWIGRLSRCVRLLSSPYRAGSLASLPRGLAQRCLERTRLGLESRLL